MRIVGPIIMAIVLVLFAVFYFGSRNSLGNFQVLEVKDMRYISPENLIDDAKKADIVFVGEQHSVMAHHEAQLDIIRALKLSGAHIAIGLEMFTADEQPALDRWVAGEMSVGEFKRIFEEYWQIPWALYKNIFLYAREEKIPLIGLNIPTDISRKVSEKGFSALTQEDLRRLPGGLTCDVDEKYMDFIKTVYKAHGRSGVGFVHFCEAQLLWDKMMAYRLVEYLDKHPGTTVVVLSGLVHSWKKGIPEQVRRLSQYSYRVILPLTADTSKDTMNTQYLDYFLD